jgi:hypothetical protein
LRKNNLRGAPLLAFEKWPSTTVADIDRTYFLDEARAVRVNDWDVFEDEDPSSAA